MLSPFEGLLNCPQTSSSLQETTIAAGILLKIRFAQEELLSSAFLVLNFAHYVGKSRSVVHQPIPFSFQAVATSSQGCDWGSGFGVPQHLT